MDSATIAIGLGLIISLLLTEAYGLAAGGMIVPGYVALQFHHPCNVLLTLAVALLTYLIVAGISKQAIVYGRRRIVLMLLVGFLLGHLTTTIVAASIDAGISDHSGVEGVFCVVGHIVPGLIALWFDRQGTLETLGAVLTSSAVVRLGIIILGLEILS